MDDLNEVIAATLQVPVESVPDDGTMESVPNWDSIGHLNLVMTLESRYKVKFTLDDILAMRDVPAIRRTIAARTGG